MDIVVPCYLIDMFSSKHGQKGFRRVRHPCGLGDTPKSFRMGAHVPLINWKSNRFSEKPTRRATLHPSNCSYIRHKSAADECPSVLEGPPNQWDVSAVGNTLTLNCHPSQTGHRVKPNWFSEGSTPTPWPSPGD
jgi:hypothetical protein